MKTKQKGLKHIALIGLTVCTVFQSAGVTLAAAGDTKGHWAEGKVQSWIDQGRVQGYPDGTFKPDAPISRAEFMAMANRAFELSASASLSFSDVKESDWYYAAVAQAISAGYIKGYGDGTLKPNHPVSRQEAAAMVSSLLNLETDQTVDALKQVKDKESIPDWSKGAIGGVLREGMMSGYPDRTFRPSQSITRAEAVVTLDRVLASRTEKVTYQDAGVYGGSPESPQSIKGNVEVNNSGITLRDVVIEGDLILAKGIGEGEVTLLNVTVKGKTHVQGGGMNSVIIKDSNLSALIVNKADGKVRIESTGTTVVQEVQLQSGAKLEEKDLKGEGFTNVVVSNANSLVTVIGSLHFLLLNAPNVELEVPAGEIGAMEIGNQGSNTKLKLGNSTIINSLTINAPTMVTGTGTVRLANVNANGTSFEKRPEKVETPSGITITLPSNPGPGPGPGSQPPAPPTVDQFALKITSDKTVLKPSETAKVNVLVTAQDLYSGQLKIQFDRSKLEVVSDQLEVPAQSPLNRGRTIPVVSSANNTEGTIVYAASLVGDRSGYHVKDEVLFSFTIRAKAGLSDTTTLIEIDSETLTNSKVEKIELKKMEALTINIKP